MTEEIEEEYDLESVGRRIEAFLENGIEAVGGRAQDGETMECLLKLEHSDDTPDPRSELTELLEDEGYGSGTLYENIDTYMVELDQEGLELALGQPYVTAAQANRDLTVRIDSS